MGKRLTRKTAAVVPHAMSQLVALPDSVLWTSRSWAELARLPAPAKHVVVLPMFGFADWGLGRPLDLEETLGTAVLRAALGQPAGKKLSLLILPPLRWVLGPYPHCLFGVDYETAHDLLREIATSVHVAGFRKIVLLNTSPWNEELVDAAGRELRAGLGLQPFLINFAALGLDLHPVRPASRVGVQCAACAVYGTLPGTDRPHAEISFSDFRPGNIRQPGAVPFDRELDDARREGATIIAAAGRKLALLWAEVAACRPLAADGRVPVRRALETKAGNRSRK